MHPTTHIQDETENVRIQRNSTISAGAAADPRSQPTETTNQSTGRQPYDTPLVSIGIPTFNRSEQLKRSIESALQQDYPNIEVIVSDNASPDSTQQLCQRYSETDHRFRAMIQEAPIKPTENFLAVLSESKGKYFMWLGDDDWLDPNYVSVCLEAMTRSNDIVIASGQPLYYRGEHFARYGKCLQLTHRTWWRRVLKYYSEVTDNGIFYGLMERRVLEKVQFKNEMASDWHLIANLLVHGKCITLPQTCVHREMGGASHNASKTAKAFGASRLAATFPYVTIAIGAFRNVATIDGNSFARYSIPMRCLLGATLTSVILFKTTIRKLKRSAVKIRDCTKSPRKSNAVTH